MRQRQLHLGGAGTIGARADEANARRSRTSIVERTRRRGRGVRAQEEGQPMERRPMVLAICTRKEFGERWRELICLLVSSVKRIAMEKTCTQDEIP